MCIRDRPLAEREEFDEQAQEHGEPDRQQEVGGGPRKGHQHGVFHDVPEIPGIDGYRFGPAEDEGAGQAGQYEDEQAHGVDVRHRVERQPPEHGGCGVTPLEGRPAVGDLMQDDPEHQRHERHRQAFYGDRKVNVEHVLPYRQAQEALFAELHHVGTRFQRAFGVITAFAVKRERALLELSLIHI